MTQVSIDNQTPQVRILAPHSDETLPLRLGSGVIFQVEANDTLQLSRVEFYVDEKLVGSLVQGPFNLAWAAQGGAHHLRVQALDLAGNASQATVGFSVK